MSCAYLSDEQWSYVLQFVPIFDLWNNVRLVSKRHYSLVQFILQERKARQAAGTIRRFLTRYAGMVYLDGIECLKAMIYKPEFPTLKGDPVNQHIGVFLKDNWRRFPGHNVTLNPTHGNLFFIPRMGEYVPHVVLHCCNKRDDVAEVNIGPGEKVTFRFYNSSMMYVPLRIILCAIPYTLVTIEFRNYVDSDRVNARFIHLTTETRNAALRFHGVYKNIAYRNGMGRLANKE